jgi:hypothetical protein
MENVPTGKYGLLWIIEVWDPSNPMTNNWSQAWGTRPDNPWAMPDSGKPDPRWANRPTNVCLKLSTFAKDNTSTTPNRTLSVVLQNEQQVRGGEEEGDDLQNRTDASTERWLIEHIEGKGWSQYQTYQSIEIKATDKCVIEIEGYQSNWYSGIRFAGAGIIKEQH